MRILIGALLFCSSAALAQNLPDMPQPRLLDPERRDVSLAAALRQCSISLLSPRSAFLEQSRSNTAQERTKAAAYRYTWGLKSEDFTPRQVADKSYWAAVTAMYASSVFDIEAFHHSCPASARNCSELNPVLGRSRKQQYPVKMGINTALAYFLLLDKRWDMQDKKYKVKTGYPPWWVWAHAWTGLNVLTGILNLRGGASR